MKIEERKKAIEEEAVKIAYLKKELELATLKYNKLMTSEYKIIMFKKCITPPSIINEDDKEYIIVLYEVDTNIITYKKIKGESINENNRGAIDYTEYFKDYDIPENMDENFKNSVIDATFAFKDLVYNLIHDKNLSTWEEVKNNIEEILSNDYKIIKNGYYYKRRRR